MKLNHPISSYKLDWLLSPDAAGMIHQNDGLEITHLPYNLPPEVGNAWAESLSLRDGIALFRAVHELEPSPLGQLISLLNVHSLPEEAMFNSQVWLSGLACHREYWQGRDHASVDIIAGPGRDTFRYYREWQAEVMVEGGVTSKMCSLVMPESMLRSFVGDEAALQLLNNLGLSTTQPTVVRPLSLHVSAALREAMAGPFLGVARKLYAQAKVLDYLADLYHCVVVDMKESKEPSNRKRIKELYDYLIHLDGRLPTLSNLAKEFGLSARRLNSEFTSEYGKSIFNVITNYRLEQAHASLLEDAIPMKVLAIRLGYSHVNHFISAFKRKFGYTPGSLRKK